MALTLSELVAVETKQAIYARAISVATGLDLPVTTWQTGDETRSQYWLQAETLATWEGVVAGYAAAGFLDYCAADADLYDWLVLLAYQVYGYVADEATYAQTTVTLTNSLGAYYEPAAGDLTLKSSTSGKTYHNTTGGVLASGPGTTLDVTVEADEPGSASSAAAGEIDTVVTSMLGVTCTNAAAATGTDDETAESIVSGCRAKLGALSPNGPADAYNYVACNATLTTTTAVTRSRTYDDSTTGDVTVYLAGPSGAVGAGDVTLVTTAIGTWATPLCVTPAVTSAANKTQAITYELWLYDSVGMTTAEVESAVSTALAALFLARPIGGDIKLSVGTGFLYHSMLEGVFRYVFGEHFVDVSVTAPAADVAIAANEVPALGAVTATAIHFETRP